MKKGKFIKEYVSNFLLNNDKPLPTTQEESKVYELLNTARKLFHKPDIKKVKFFQLWQQKQFISDFERAIKVLENTNAFTWVDPKDKYNKECYFILPEKNMLIRINYLKGTRRFLGWVEYAEASL